MCRHKSVSLRIVKADISAVLVLNVSCLLRAFAATFFHVPADHLVSVTLAAQREQVLLVKGKAHRNNSLFVIAHPIQHLLGAKVPNNNGNLEPSPKVLSRSQKVALAGTLQDRHATVVALQISVLLLPY